MRLDDFYRAVRKALESAFLWPEVELVKDYANQRLILTSIHIAEYVSAPKELTYESSDNAVLAGRPGECQFEPVDYEGGTSEANEDASVDDPERQPLYDRASPNADADLQDVKLETDEDVVPTGAVDSPMPPPYFPPIDGLDTGTREDAAEDLTFHPPAAPFPGFSMDPNQAMSKFQKNWLAASMGVVPESVDLSNERFEAEAALDASGRPRDYEADGDCFDAAEGNTYQNLEEEFTHQPLENASLPAASSSKPNSRKKAGNKSTEGGPNKRPPKFSCDFCSMRFAKRDSRSNHILEVHGDDDEPYHCLHCSFKAETKYELNKHKKEHTAEKPFVCRFCGDGFRLQTQLNRHEKSHKEGKKFACRYCDYRANDRHSVKEHETVMHHNTGALYHCPHCNFKTVQDRRRVAHIKAHEKNSFYECEYCNKKIWDRIDYKNHVNKHITAAPRKKNIACPHCDLKFYNNELLRNHLFVHTGKKAYKCRICGLEFRAFKSMMKHFAKHHPNEKAFHCSACNFFSNNLRENNRHASTIAHLENTRSLMLEPPPAMHQFQPTA